MWSWDGKWKWASTMTGIAPIASRKRSGESPRRKTGSSMLVLPNNAITSFTCELNATSFESTWGIKSGSIASCLAKYLSKRKAEAASSRFPIDATMQTLVSWPAESNSNSSS
eukprot:3486837-Amphidinium_carterae.1